MSDQPLLSKLATDRLRAAVEGPIELPSPQARDRAIGMLAVAIAEQAKRRRRRRVAIFGLVAAAASLVGVVFTTMLHRRPPAVGEKTAVKVVAHPTGPVAVVHGGAASPMGVGALLETGDRVQTQMGAHASVVLSTGTQVDVEPASELAIESVSSTQAFVATAGAARFSVAKLAAGERFVVRTADAEVEVRGTMFRVSLADSECAGTRTRVEVAEGTVLVRHGGTEVRLGAADRWPSGCFATPTASVAPVSPVASVTAVIAAASTAPAPKPATVAGKNPPVVASAASATPSSDLAAQNDLFAEAFAKKRAGDKVSAALTFGRFLARFPSSTLAETAAVERMRLLSGDAARAAAKDYLARFPNGSARAEADALAH